MEFPSVSPGARLTLGELVLDNGSSLTWIANFIWGIADDVLRDLYVRGKYRDVILPMTVLRRLDAVLEPTEQAVLDMKAALDKAGITH
jgi:type I restriction enzyme M protein